MEPSEAAAEAVKGLTAWDKIAQMVDSFGGGWEAVAAISVICVSVVVIIVAFLWVAYLTIRSHNRTKAQIARINAKKRG
jgi:hypothetical protein